MTIPKAIIVGTGGHAQVVWAAWQAAYRAEPTSVFSLAGWLETADYRGGTSLHDLTVFTETASDWASIREQGIMHFYMGIGMVRAGGWRWAIMQQFIQQGLQPMTIIHPTAIVDASAQIAEGCYIGARAVVQPFAHLGEGAIINTGAIVEHHAQVGRNVHIAPGTVVCGEVKIGAHSMIGAGSVIIQGLTVGEQVTVGAGSVVTKNLPDYVTVWGNPAKNHSVPNSQNECDDNIVFKPAALGVVT